MIRCGMGRATSLPMARTTATGLLPLLTFALLACGTSTAEDLPPTGIDSGTFPPPDGAVLGDASVPTDGGTPPPRDGSVTPPPTDGGTPIADSAVPMGRGPRLYDPPTTPGGAWVRNNPMFISGLTPSMGAPPTDFVRAYFDDFGANAAHLWQDALPTEAQGWNAHRSGVPYVAWTTAAGRSSGHGPAVLGGVAVAAPGRIGYQVSDEPRSMADLLAIEEGVREIRAMDPDALIILNFGSVDDGGDPGGGGLIDAMLRYTVDHGLADIISHDSYTMRRGQYRWLEHLRTISQAHDLPYWRYLMSYIEPGRDRATESDMRWHAQVGLVYGYTGHSWFLYQISSAHGTLQTTLFERTGDFASPRTRDFAWAAQLNHELANISPILTQLRSTDVRYVASELFGVEVGRPDGTRDFTPGAGGDRYLVGVDADGASLGQHALVGFFEDDWGERYLMVQNPNHSNGTRPTDSTSDATITLTFDFSAAPAGMNRARLERFDPTTGAISDVELSEADLALRIPAGEIVFLKYKTGAPWASR